MLEAGVPEGVLNVLVFGMNPQQATRNVQELQPRTVLGSHLAPARGLTDALSDTVRMAPGGPAVSMPDQATFERMLKGAAGG